MRVRDVQVRRVHRRELTAEGPCRLRGERRTRGWRDSSVFSDDEAVDEERARDRGPGLDADEVPPGRVEKDVARIRRARQVERGPFDWNEAPTLVEPESRVVAAGAGYLVAFIGHVDEVSADRDADRLDSPRGNGSSADEAEAAVSKDAKD